MPADGRWDLTRSLKGYRSYGCMRVCVIYLSFIQRHPESVASVNKMKSEL